MGSFFLFLWLIKGKIKAMRRDVSAWRYARVAVARLCLGCMSCRSPPVASRLAIASRHDCPDDEFPSQAGCNWCVIFSLRRAWPYDPVCLSNSAPAVMSSSTVCVDDICPIGCLILSKALMGFVYAVAPICFSSRVCDHSGLHHLDL